MSFFQAIKRHPLVSTVVVVVVLPLVALVLWTTIALSYSYSTGEHAGFLQKFSKRGWLCKTWEGDLQLAAIPGVAPQMFYFSVRSDSIAEVLNGLAGKEVVLTYDQHVGLPTSCYGDTEYFVTGARLVGPP